MPKPRKSVKARDRRARATQAAQASVEKKTVTPTQYLVRRAAGWALVALAAIAGLTHWLAHIGLLYEDNALWDLTIGYPTAGALGIAGAMVLSR